jgi:5-methylcytosine-specific restriction endonuclease McrA
LVISTAGTIFINWLDRWSRLPGGRALSTGYERDLRQLLATDKVVFHPTAFRQAIPLSSLAQRVDDLLTLLSNTSRALAARRRRLPVGQSSIPAGADAAALEGMLTETRQTRRGRSARLRNEALRRARGTCAVCRNDFRALLDGDGQRVLQVHHLQQLAALDTPRINSIDDLAVVCANCHLLIHMDHRNALSVTALRKMLEDDGRYPLAPAPRPSLSTS